MLRCQCGSSPHLRGTCFWFNITDLSNRFIPAPAGNVGIPDLYISTTSVHPRTCGERKCRFINLRWSNGSSPHLRGTLLLSQCQAHPLRFIPAPAGNVSFSVSQSILFSVHPRTCGERIGRRWVFIEDDGSSPHLRGTFLVFNWFFCNQRFIPAPAGNVAEIISIRAKDSVHPRTCGERGCDHFCCFGSRGSSPHLRGTF